MATITGTTDNDQLTGTNAADTIRGLAGDDLLNGRDGNDSLDGGEGFDTILGGNGNDYVVNGTGEGSLDGGAGTDWLDLTGNDGDGGQFGLASGLGKLSPQGAFFTMKNFENIRTGNGSDAVYGTTGKNIIEGNGGDDLLYGFNGNDTIRGGDGDDEIDGGGGNDLLEGGAGNDTVYGNDGNDLIEAGYGSDVIHGGAGFDTLSYASSDVKVAVDAVGQTAYHYIINTIDYFDSIEKIVGSAYDDLFQAAATTEISAGAGDDGVFSGSGANKLSGGAGRDTLFYFFSDAGVTVNLGSGSASGGWARGDRMSGFENVNGSFFNDVLTGSGGANAIYGNDGNDRINGSGGNDFLSGDFGNDKLDGGSGADDLFGGDDNDEMKGASGNDRLIGGTGADTLWGGFGADRFRYDSLSDSPAAAGQMDVIRDFSRSQGDKIDLINVFDPTLTFIGQAAFSAAGQVRFQQSGGNTIVEVNTAGNNGAEMAIRLSGTINLQASDFIL